MFESLGRGWKMIMAAIRMGLEDKRLLIPSLLTVFNNFLFGFIVFANGVRVASGGAASGQQLMHNSHSLVKHLSGGDLSAFMDRSGMTNVASNVGTGTGETCLSGALILALWWLINRALEGVTTAMAYSHLTAGPGSGKFSLACKAVAESAWPLIQLGVATWVANNIASFLKNKQNNPTASFGLMGFLGGMVQIFWTLAGHLLLPAIVIEGCSFTGALKRADKIASGNLLTIGFGEVGIDEVAKLSMLAMGGLGTLITGYAYCSGTIASLSYFAAIFIWGCLVVLMTAAFMYIRAAFYTCLYVWAIEAEAVHEIERRKITPPAPLAAALA
jgi:hypothetical protein